jgi:hypothetical protein
MMKIDDLNEVRELSEPELKEAIGGRNSLRPYYTEEQYYGTYQNGDSNGGSGRRPGEGDLTEEDALLILQLQSGHF